MGFGVGGLSALAVLFLGVVMLSNLGLAGHASRSDCKISCTR